jgi:hypothetical protein
LVTVDKCLSQKRMGGEEHTQSSRRCLRAVSWANPKRLELLTVRRELRLPVGISYFDTPTLIHLTQIEIAQYFSLIFK